MAFDNASPRKKTPHLDFIDGIRALAALFVVLAHAYFEPTAGYYAATPWMYKLGLTYGRYAVDAFIVVSGFCLMLPVARRNDEMGSLSDFFKRRIRRILPPYYAVLILAVLFTLVFANQKLGTIWDLCLPVTWQKIATQIFLIHNLPLGLKGGTINYPLWSIAVEFQVYLFMPLIVVSLRRWGNAWTLGWVTLLSALLYFAPPLEWRITNLWFLALFTFGAIAARECVRREGVITAPLRLPTLGLWAFVVVVTLASGHNNFDRFRFAFDMLMGVATALLLTITMADSHAQKYPLTRFLSWRPLVAIGVFSYSLYLTHALTLHAIYLLVHTFARPSPPLMFLILVLCIPLIVGFAYGFYLAFERPFLSGSAKARARTVIAPAQSAAST